MSAPSTGRRGVVGGRLGRPLCARRSGTGWRSDRPPRPRSPGWVGKRGVVVGLAGSRRSGPSAPSRGALRTTRPATPDDFRTTSRRVAPLAPLAQGRSGGSLPARCTVSSIAIAAQPWCDAAACASRRQHDLLRAGRLAVLAIVQQQRPAKEEAHRLPGTSPSAFATLRNAGELESAGCAVYPMRPCAGVAAGRAGSRAHTSSDSLRILQPIGPKATR